MPYVDKQKRKEALRRWYLKHRDEQIARVKKNSKKLRTEVRQHKEAHACTDCRQFYPYYVMDFDHVRGEKIANIADILNRNHSRAALEAEIAKCDLVCSNCHRARTHNRRMSRGRGVRSSSPAS